MLTAVSWINAGVITVDGGCFVFLPPGVASVMRGWGGGAGKGGGGGEVV